MTPQVPRILVLLSTLAVLVYVNRTAPRILPAVLALLVLYAALTNLPRAQALLGGFDDALARVIHPSTSTGPRPGPNRMR
jgi:hypothetical protein